MLTFTCTVVGVSPYSPSKYLDADKRKGETPKAYEERLWRDKAHYNAEGSVIIPGMAFQKSVAAAAKFTPRKIEGRGNSTYAKQIRSGVFVRGSVVLMHAIPDPKNKTRTVYVPYTKVDLKAPGVYMCSTTGDASGLGKRVPKLFPEFWPWQGELSFDIYNPTVSKETFETYVAESGQFIGVGRFRPEVGGFAGRYEVRDVVWTGGWTEEDMARGAALEEEELEVA